MASKKAKELEDYIKEQNADIEVNVFNQKLNYPIRKKKKRILKR